MRGRSHGAIERMSNNAAARAACSLLGLLIAGCFEDPPATEGTSTGPTTSAPTEPTTTDPSTTTEANSETTIGTTEPPTISATETSADTTALPTTSDASTSTSSDDGSSSSSSDTGEVLPTFFDDFDRADSQAIGNGWIEKQPTIFSISENEVVAADDLFHPYYEQVVYQDESVSDIELRVEFRIDSPDPLNEPHLVARAQPEGLEPSAFNRCYILVPQLGQDRLCLMRFDPGGAFTQQCTDWPDSDFVIGDRYRLVMTIEGPGPVEMTGRLEHAAGDAWEEVVAVEWVDNNAMQIDGPGAWGFSGGTSGTYYTNFVFDNYSAFYR